MENTDWSKSLFDFISFFHTLSNLSSKSLTQLKISLLEYKSESLKYVLINKNLLGFQLLSIKY